MFNFIRKHFRVLSIVSLAFVLVVTVFSVFTLRRISFDYDFESFFPTDDPDLEVYLKFRNTFEYDNEYVLLAIENKKGVFDSTFLSHVSSFSDSLRELPDITRTISPVDIENTIISDLGVMRVPYLHISEPARYTEDSALIYRSEELRSTFFAKDARSLCIYIKTTEGISKQKSDTLLQRVNNLLNQFKFDKVHMAGKMNGQKVYLEKLQSEFLVFFLASFFLVVLFLAISFRSFWGVWVPVLIVLLAILWTLALMTLTGKALDIMTVLLPTMMFVVGMSDVVHIVTKYLEELRETRLRTGTHNRFEALIKTIKEAGFATFITLLTTALGFLSLLNSHIKPIRDFGIYTSLGVFVAFVLAYSIMPVVLNLLPEPKLKLESGTSLFWDKRLHRLLRWILRHSRAIAVATVVLVLLCIVGIYKIERNNFLIEGLTRNDELRKDFDFFERQYSGVRPFELQLTPTNPQSTLLGTTELRAIDTLEHFLKTRYGVGFLLSPATVVKAINKAQHNGDPDFFKLPESDSAIANAVEIASPFRKRKEYKILLTTDGRTGRITGKMNDIGSREVFKLNDSLAQFLKNTPLMQSVNVVITGGATMLDKNNEYLVVNTMQGLALSILVVALIIALIHRSWRMVIIAVIPNLLPIIFIGGLMGWCGIELKSSTSIIFSIAFGIATDDTIHFLARLRLERMKGKSYPLAVKRTFLSTGKAVIVTSLILCAGFFTLIGSGFESTFYFGLLVSITLFVAVLTDLLLFPLLVLWLSPRHKPKAEK
ncbi:MAG: MMPL family transporter [Bacteroidetes bacterium]|nr:MMPL family transporter [Bacteroidota bacterium]